MSLVLTNTGLVTRRTTLSSWFLFAGGVLGSMFGLVEIVSVFMGIFEGYFDSCKKKLKKNKSLFRVVISKKKLRCNFDEITNEKIEIDGTLVTSNYRTE